MNEKHEYSEADEMVRYVFKHFTHLFTAVERLATKTGYTEIKAARSDSENMAKMLRKHWGHKNNPEVINALQNGFTEFQASVIKRLLAEEKDTLYVNRCEKCDRIVQTPRSCCCLWCGHKWYDRREQQDATADRFLPQKTNA